MANEPNPFLEQFKTTRWLDEVKGVDIREEDVIIMAQTKEPEHG